MRSLWVILVLLIGTTGESFATPPEPNDPFYVGYSGKKWDRDFAVLSGRCNREEIGAVLGGVAGGVVGRSVSDRDDRVVGTLIGAAAGALLGARIGRELDQGDRACIGHALEIGVNGRPIVWDNAVTGVRYELIPRGGTKGRNPACRDFTLVVAYGNERIKHRTAACHSRPGVWEIRTA